MRISKKVELRARRRRRIRKKIAGSAERPRMSVKFSGRHIYVQFIDDGKGSTLQAVSTRGSTEAPETAGANVLTARWLGAIAAGKAKEKGISEVVFDRSGARYHGKVKAFADAAREAGLKF